MATEYKFTDQDNTVPHVKAGDYVVAVVGYSMEQSKGAKTKGSDMMVLEMLVTGENSRFVERLVIHPSCSRKIDTFIKCFDIRKSDKQRPKKGESVTFMPGTVLGTRGWCLLKETEFDFKSGDKGTKNEIAVFYTDREKFAQIRVADLLGGDQEEDTDFE